MACRKTPYTLKKSRVSHSPFRTIDRVKKTLKSKKRIGFTARSSLKSMGLLPRSSGCYVLGQKYLSLKD
jgi:hypothetical protein